MLKRLIIRALVLILKKIFIHLAFKIKDYTIK